MKELLTRYSIDEIIMFIVLFAGAIKGVLSFYDWAIEKINKTWHKKTKKESQVEKFENMLNDIIKCQDECKSHINNITDSVTLLMNSDKDDIKAWITEKHHYFCYKLGYIDDYSLDCIEKRYSHYKKEGGNSYIETLMGELRALPKKPLTPEEYKNNN